MKSRKQRRFQIDTSQDDPYDMRKTNDELRLCLVNSSSMRTQEVDYEIFGQEIPLPMKFLNKYFWGDLIVMFNPDEQDEFWNSQHEWKVVSWKLHSSSGVHTLMTDDRIVVSHAIGEENLKRIRTDGSRRDRVLGYTTQQWVLNSPCFLVKSWLVQDQTVLDEELSIPEQTATGKGTSNPLMAGSLPKTTKPT
ncbi:hypothetical protein Tco_0736796 [Tanacetum coccineum]